MKRDLDLIREILLEIEKENTPNVSVENLFKKDFKKDSEDILSEHILLLSEADFIDSMHETLENGKMIFVGNVRITWKGYEFLEQIRNDSIWKEAKQILSKTNSFTIPIITNVASSIISLQLGLK